jgi:hypothetical protein
MIKFPIPSSYKVLPNSIDFNLKGFERSCMDISTLSVDDVKCEQLYQEFVARIENALLGEFLPVVRLCDGEYIFIVGRNYGSLRLNRLSLWVLNIKETIKIILKFNFKSAGGNLYKSGNYNNLERKETLNEYLENLKWVSNHGILAMHFSWGKVPFTEGLWPYVKATFDYNSIEITRQNYFPFYFVYAYLASSESNNLFENKRMLIINSAEGYKKQSIIESLFKRNVKSVDWIAISADRSMYDIIKIDKFINNIDAVLIGAGVGKLNIIRQLEKLKVPCIDIGYYMEILAEGSNKYKRTMCCTDIELEKYNGIN